MVIIIIAVKIVKNIRMAYSFWCVSVKIWVNPKMHLFCSVINFTICG